MTNWQTKKLGEVAEISVSGVDKIINKDEIQVKLCNYMDVYNNNVISSDKGLSNGSVTKKELSGFRLRKGQVIITKDSETPGDIARSAYVAKDFDYVVCGYHLAIISPKDEIDGHYIKYLFDVPSYQNYFSQLANGVTRFGLTLPAIQNAEVIMPSINEQKVIVNVVRNFDEFLFRVREKLTASEELKKGLTQQIFAGKLRFKDDNGQDLPEWEKKKMGDILKERKEYAQKGGKYEHISLTTSGVVPKTARYERDFLVKSEEKKYRITKIDDICYNPANLKFGVIARNKYKDGIFSPMYITYEVIEDDISFIEFLVTRSDFIQRALAYEQGTVYERMSVGPEDFSEIIATIPSIAEQQKIAEFLSVLDDMITSLRNLLKSAQSQKKWLLDNLVTGKVRLPEFKNNNDNKEESK